MVCLNFWLTILPLVHTGCMTRDVTQNMELLFIASAAVFSVIVVDFRRFESNNAGHFAL